MTKIFNIKLILILLLSLLFFRQESFAQYSGKLLVAPVNVLTQRSSYGVYPNTSDMIANDIINSLNKYSMIDAPDLGMSKSLIESYGLSEDYNEFLTNYRDNRVIDHKTCNRLSQRLGVDKILLISTGYDTQNLFLKRSKTTLINDASTSMIPFARLFSKDLLFIGLPFLMNFSGDSFKEEDPLTPNYKLNVRLALIDAFTGLSIWEKAYQQDFPASDFGNPINSFGENILSSEKLKKFSEKIASECSIEIYTAARDSSYSSVKSSIVSSSYKQNKKTSRDGKMTKDGQSFSYDKYTENNRKQNYKNWVQERVKR